MANEFIQPYIAGVKQVPLFTLTKESNSTNSTNIHPYTYGVQELSDTVAVGL